MCPQSDAEHSSSSFHRHIRHFKSRVAGHTTLLDRRHCVVHKAEQELENVAINDVLRLKAARHCAIANVECFGGPGTSAT